MIETSFVEEIDCGSFFDHIDDLLDFPGDDVDAGFPPDGNSNNAFPTIWPVISEPFPSSDSGFSGKSSSDLSGELSVPYNDIVQLEWLSSFVEDSSYNGNVSMIKEDSSSYNKCSGFTYYHFQSSSPVSVLQSSSSSPGKKRTFSGSSETITPACRGARSKRSRPQTFNSRPENQISMIPFVSENSVESPVLLQTPETEEVKETTQKKIQNSSCPAGVRKCSHCEVTKTPQWRAGPMGPKTLCNACGVRHKSGGLFPEYRPAASPTFMPYLHSNSHKKVPNEWAKGVLNDEENLTEEKVDEVLKAFLRDFKQDCLKKNGWPVHVSAYKHSKSALNAYTRILARKYPNMLVNSVSPDCTKNRHDSWSRAHNSCSGS